MRLDILGHIFTAALAIYLVYYDKDATPSSVGFVLSIAGKCHLKYFVFAPHDPRSLV